MHKGVTKGSLFSFCLFKVDLFSRWYIRLTFLYCWACDQQPAYAQIRQTEKYLPNYFHLQEAGAILSVYPQL